MDKHSPTPWRVVTHDDSDECDIYSAQGTPVCTMSHCPDNPEADAALIVEAVNEHIARHRMIDVETLDHVASERDRLRDIVRRLKDEYEQLEERDTVCNTDRTRRIEALFREALGEQEP